MNSVIHSSFADARPKMMPFGDAGRPIALNASSSGSLSALSFATDPIWSRPLKGDDVEVEIKAVGLNFRDVLIAMGEHEDAGIGNEAAGYVSRVGECVTSVQVGDRVVFMNGSAGGGCIKTFGRQSADAVVKLPDFVSFEDAASLSCVYATVIYSLYDVARLCQGETILVHAGAGGVGQAAIQLANLVGAEVFRNCVYAREERPSYPRVWGERGSHFLQPGPYICKGNHANDWSPWCRCCPQLSVGGKLSVPPGISSLHLVDS